MKLECGYGTCMYDSHSTCMSRAEVRALAIAVVHACLKGMIRTSSQGDLGGRSRPNEQRDKWQVNFVSGVKLLIVWVVKIVLRLG